MSYQPRSYDVDAVKARTETLAGVRRLSYPPAKGDDPLVKAAAVWKDVGHRVK